MTLEQLENTLYVLERLEYLFISANPDSATEIVKTLRRLVVTIQRVINTWDRVKATKEVNM